MASYWEQVAAAYNEGYSHSELQDHHNIQDWGDAPRPPIERAWDSSPISPTEDWLKNAPLPSQTIGTGNYSIDAAGIDQSRPTISDQDLNMGEGYPARIAEESAPDFTAETPTDQIPLGSTPSEQNQIINMEQGSGHEDVSGTNTLKQLDI